MKKTTTAGADYTWSPTIGNDDIGEPIRIKQPSTILLTGVDLFDDRAIDARYNVIAVIAYCHRHEFFVRTEHAQTMRDYITGDEPRPSTFMDYYAQTMRDWPLPNLWLGVTVTSQQEADERIPLLLDTPAAHRFAVIETGEAVDITGHLDRVLVYPGCDCEKR